ncbi:MAG: 30S ribosomal protein S4 [Candidatus Pacebacteria bacterium]|nr:30S ribosomal protein S4 [Candidatus Paceibacterota bacterium]
MADTKCKTCRRTGQKLFSKEEKCFGAKCPMIKKPYAPGKKTKRPKSLSEYGIQLREKQKLKFFYGLRERQFANYVKEAISRGGSGISDRLASTLESRLDNVVFRAGFAKSRSIARQIVGHGHICVNGRKITIPSFQIKKGDKISLRPQSAGKAIFKDLDVWLKKYNPPAWLKVDKDKKESEMAKPISGIDAETGANMNSIIEFYSR